MPVSQMSTSDLPNELDTLIQKATSDKRPFVISIDGVGGSGKTTLAKFLASKYAGFVLSLDCYLKPHQGNYKPSLRYDRLSNDLGDAIACAKVIIIEGLCVLAVLEKLNRAPDYSIYIRSVNEIGEWNDKYYYSEENDLTKTLTDLDKLEALHPDTPGIANYDRELVHYHIENKPITNADFVLDKFIPS